MQQYLHSSPSATQELPTTFKSRGVLRDAPETAPDPASKVSSQECHVLTEEQHQDSSNTRHIPFSGFTGLPPTWQVHRSNTLHLHISGASFLVTPQRQETTRYSLQAGKWELPAQVTYPGVRQHQGHVVLTHEITPALHLDTGAAAGELPCKVVLPWEDDPQSQKPSS